MQTVRYVRNSTAALTAHSHKLDKNADLVKLT